MAAVGIISVKPLPFDSEDGLLLSLEINKRCPLACPACFLSRNRTIEEDELNSEQLCVLLSKALQTQSKSRKFRAVCLHGQEPTVTPDRVADLLQTHRTIQRMGTATDVPFGFITSGVGGARLARVLREAEVAPDFVSVSLDGPDAISNARLRGDWRVFEHAIAGARALAPLVDRSAFTIAATVSEANAAEVPDMIPLLAAEGWTQLLLSPIVSVDAEGVFAPAVSPSLFVRTLQSCAKTLAECAANVHVQGFTFDDPAWEAQVCPDLLPGAARWLMQRAPDGNTGVSIRRSPGVNRVLRIRFDGGVLNTRRAIMAPQFIPQQTVGHPGDPPISAIINSFFEAQELAQ